MNLNKKLKCALAAALAIVLLMSAAITMPATAAESAEKTAVVSAPATEAVKETTAETTQAAESAAAEDDGSNGIDVFSDGGFDLKEFAETGDDGEDMTESTEIPSEGDKINLDADLMPYRERCYKNRIVLKWTAIQGVDGYRVYWCDLTKEGNTTTLLTTVTDRSVIVSNLKAGAKYRFTIRPFIDQGGEVKEGKGSMLIAATIPNNVLNFKLKSGAQAGTVIRWTRVPNCDGYLILRQYQGVWSEYKYLPQSEGTFKDTNVIPGHAYYYKIMSYRKDTRGYLKSGTTLLTTVCGLSAPGDTGSTSRVNRVYLQWRNIRYATGYQIYYSTDHVTYKALAISYTNSFTTKKLPPDQVVSFRIRPFRDVGKSKTRVVGTYSQFDVKVLSNSFGADVGDTYVEIDLSEQHMWYIVDNNIYVSTPVVTGNYGSMDTPTGVFSVQSMATDVSLVGDDYVSFVEYWIAFIGSSYGIHDASWRSEFGGDIYKGDGSHGCVNTPYSAVQKIYRHIDVGTPVIVHD